MKERLEEYKSKLKEIEDILDKVTEQSDPGRWRDLVCDRAFYVYEISKMEKHFTLDNSSINIEN